MEKPKGAAFFSSSASIHTQKPLTLRSSTNEWDPCFWPHKLKASLLFCPQLPSCFLGVLNSQGKLSLQDSCTVKGAGSMAIPGGTRIEQV